MYNLGAPRSFPPAINKPSITKHEVGAKRKRPISVYQLEGSLLIHCLKSDWNSFEEVQSAGAGQRGWLSKSRTSAA
ncbi:hypothetical protein GE061_002699 [Apolygus lucorum]|uniref:Uncharacterized protein n=1 Tax=Apolygus lucorum TaxID=248454 RepID=A0A8S9X7N1_APOLU|nr:hypothetical protein GE061_002699 [Apolygus lucorum]